MVDATLAVDTLQMLAMAQPGTGTYLRAGALGGPLSVSDYVAIVRRALQRSLAWKFSSGTNTLLVYLLDAALERQFAGEPHPSKPLRDELQEALYDEMGHLPSTAARPALLVSSAVRPQVREALCPERRDITVLCYEEIPPDVNVQPVARVSSR
jgi:type III secretion protein V